jgi:anti-sigma factor RsiW
MAIRRRQPESPDAQLARLADGNLDDAERARLEQAVASSPELAALLAEQQRALALTGAIDIAAPPWLHERIVAPPARPRRARRLPSRRGVVVVVAAMAILLVLASRIASPDVRSDVHFALASATLPPPAVRPADDAVLTAAVDGVAFPNWRQRGWRAIGARSDTLDGRGVETVFYRSGEYPRIGYSIVAGAPLSVGATKRTVVSNGVSYAVLDADGATVVTWRRADHTCVLAADQVPASVLLRLAGWV